MYMDLTDMISGGTEEQQVPEQKLTKEDISEFFPHRWFFILFFPANFPIGRSISVARERFGWILLTKGR